MANLYMADEIVNLLLYLWFSWQNSQSKRTAINYSISNQLKSKAMILLLPRHFSTASVTYFWQSTGVSNESKYDQDIEISMTRTWIDRKLLRLTLANIVLSLSSLLENLDQSIFTKECSLLLSCCLWGCCEIYWRV